MTDISQRRRGSVLIKSNAEVAEDLRANPGQWFLVGIGTPGQEHLLSQTAYRIRQNYKQGQGLSSFEADEDGEFNAIASTNFTLPDGTTAACVVHAVWQPYGSAALG